MSFPGLETSGWPGVSVGRVCPRAVGGMAHEMGVYQYYLSS